MRSRDTIQSKEVEIAPDLRNRRRDDVNGAERRPDAQGTSPIHSQMQSNVRGWHNIPIATVLIKFIDGRFVKFLYRCYSARRFDQIVSDLYKRRIAFKPLFLALIRCIVCPSPTTTRGSIPSRPLLCPFQMFIYVIVCIFRPPRAVGHGFRRRNCRDGHDRNMYPLPRAW